MFLTTTIRRCTGAPILALLLLLVLAGCGSEGMKPNPAIARSTPKDVTSTTTGNALSSHALTNDANGPAHGLGKGSSTLKPTKVGQSTSLSDAAPDPVSTNVQITPSYASIPKGSTQTLHATATMSDGTTQGVSSSTAWQSSNPGVATVDGSGAVTAITAGTAQISGNYQTYSASASVTVINATVTSVSASASARLAKRTATQLTATASLSDGSTQNVTGSANWSSSAIGVATVNASGLVTGVAPGNAVISSNYGGKTGIADIAVTAATLISLSVLPLNVSLPRGATARLQATGTFSDGTTQNVAGSLTYGSSNTAVAAVDASGVVHGVGPGTAKITAAMGAVQTSFQVIITTATLQGIVVTPTSATLVANGRQQFTATGNFSDGSTMDLTLTSAWNSSSTSVVSIDALGLATGSSVGTTTMTATTAGVSGSTKFVVSPATITTVTVSPLLATVGREQTQAFTAMAALSDGTAQDVTASAHWSVSDSSVAQISNSAGAAGTVTGKLGGAVQVTAALDSVSGSAGLLIAPITVVSVAVSPSSTSLALGFPERLTATATYDDGSTSDVTRSVRWSSSNASVVSVALGVVAPLEIGTSNVIATLQGHSGSATIAVTPATLGSIAISPSSVSPATGLASQLTATGTFSDGSVQNITSSVHWTSSVGAMATISDTGLLLSTAPGSTMISATLGPAKQSVKINVSAAMLQSITVTAPQTAVALGFSLPLTATGYYSDGSTQDLTTAVHWSSSDSTIGLIRPSGELSGLLAGSLSANASFQGVAGSLAVTVTPATLVSLSISPSGSRSAMLTHPMTLTGHFSDGNTQTISTGVHWSVSNTLLASITQSGLLLPLSLGDIMVTASYGSLSTQVAISLI